MAWPAPRPGGGRGGRGRPGPPRAVRPGASGCARRVARSPLRPGGCVSSAQRPGSASHSPATGAGCSAMPMASSALARSRPWRRSRSAAAGRSGQDSSSLAAAAAAPRRASGGGAGSSTIAPVAGRAVRSRSGPGPRPGGRGSAGRRPGRAAAPGRRRAAAADPQGEPGDPAVTERPHPGQRPGRARVQGQGPRQRSPGRVPGLRLGAEPDVDDVRQRPAARLHQRHAPRPSRSWLAPRRLSAALATPVTAGTGSPSDWIPRTRTGRMAGVSDQFVPDAHGAGRAASPSPPSRCR